MLKIFNTCEKEIKVKKMVKHAKIDMIVLKYMIK